MLIFVLFSPPISRIFAGTFDGVLVPDVVDAAVCVGGDQSPLFLAFWSRYCVFCPWPPSAVRHVWSIDCAQFMYRKQLLYILQSAV